MKIIKSSEDMQAWASRQTVSGRKIALVPTMGALHEGHLTLVREAGKRAEAVAVSIFVNPTQFGPTEDYTRYPRELSRDGDLLADLDVDVIFAPEVDQIYAPHDRTTVVVSDLDKQLCGQFRPGHFVGVTSIVARLFNICRPDFGIFGMKDAQQFFILSRMCKDLHFGIKLVGVPTVRDEDGLALSSRNRYLSEVHRSQAPVIHKTLGYLRDLVLNGERDSANLTRRGLAEIEKAPDARVQYIEIVDTDLLAPKDKLHEGDEILIAAAVYFGQTRLIDNVVMQV